MKERLVQLLEREQLSSSRFADIIGVQRSSVSHIVSGRNNPSFDFLQKTLLAFPGLRAEWLLLGKGKMFENEANVFSGTLFDQGPSSFPPQTRESAHESVPVKESAAETGDNATPVSGIKPAEALSKVVQVVMLYDDGSFRIFGPSNTE